MSEDIDRLRADLTREQRHFDRVQAEVIELREKLATERALADRAAALIGGDATGGEWKRGCKAFLADHRKARGITPAEKG